MSQLNKKSAVVEIFSSAGIDRNKKFTEVEKSDHNDALKYVKELSANPNPANRYELQQIIAYVVDNVIAIKTDYLKFIAEVQNTAFNERFKFKIKNQMVTAFWQAIGSTTQKTKTGYKYDSITIEALSANPVAEWAEVAAGRYDFAELIRDVTSEFERLIAQKVQTTLYATFSGLSSANFGTGSGVVAGTFDPLLVSMQNLGACTIVGDYAALQKLPALTAIASRTSDNIIDELNRTGLIGTYKGAAVVALQNPYTGLSGFNTTLDRGYIYIVPSGADSNKSLKVQFAGDMVVMEGQNTGDRSYEMTLDKHVGMGVVANTRHALAVYEDTTL